MARTNTKRILILLQSVLLFSTFSTLRAQLVDRPIEALITELSDQGVRVFYSSDLVKSSMTVLAEPVAGDPVGSLAEALEPHGLMLRPGLNDSWLVVRKPGKSRIGATARQVTVLPGDAATEPLTHGQEQIIVSASRYEIVGANTVSTRLLTDIALEYSPDIGDDPIRAVARLPGMASSGISALANVRGGEIRETLVRLDGLRLYDPFHLRDFQGVFSVVDPGVVSSMDVYTGGFPARFGDRMSGVIDVESISPPADLHHEIGFSFFNSSFLSAGKFGNERGEWVASARRSNLDILYDKFSDQPERPRYTDLFTKVGFEFSDHLKLTGSLLRATDDISLADDVDREERAAASQTDRYGWLRLDHRLGGFLSGSTMLSSTGIDSSRTGTSDKAGVSSGILRDIRSFSFDTLQSEWTRVIGARLMIDFGGHLTKMRGRYDYQDEAQFDLLFDVDGAASETDRSRDVQAAPSGREYGLFSTLQIDFSPKLSTEAGFRWSQQVINGRSLHSTEPRLGLRWAFSEATTFRAAWGRFAQFQSINELQVNDGITRFFAPQKAEHLVLGIDRTLRNGTLLRIEAYEKSMSDLRPRYENLLNSRILLPELKPDRIRIAPDSARAYGIELSVDGQSGPVHWWGSISRARVQDNLPAGNVLRSWDQTWALNAGFVMDLENWSLSTGLIVRSGWPLTPVSLDSQASFPTAVAEQRNSDRLSSYGSFDIRMSRNFMLESGDVELFFELANLTGRFNPCCVEYEVGDEEDAGLLVLDRRSYLPRIPSIGFNWSF